MRLALLLGALLLVPAAWGAPYTVAPSPSAHAPTLTTVPLGLARAAANTATISANGTSATDSMTAGIASASTLNSTRVTNQLGVDVQVRLVFRAASGATGQCVKCDLQLRNGTATSAQINLDGGTVPSSGAAGPWVTLKAGASAWIFGVGQGQILAESAATIRYELELSVGGVSCRYLTMAMTYTV